MLPHISSRALALAVLAAAACGGAAPPATQRTTFLHSARLSAIMKQEINQPFSAMTFLIHHAPPEANGEINFAALAAPAATLAGGIAKAQKLLEIPVESNEGKDVFSAYLTTLAYDTNVFAERLAQQDRAGMEALLNKLSKTCNSCHHFFRLEIADSPER